MAGSSSEWKAVLWQLLKPALVAMIVAVLATLGVLQSQNGDGQVGIAGVSHFTGLSVSEYLTLEQATALTVTDGAAFTPLASYQQITAAGEVTPTVSTTGFTAGDVQCLVNSGTNTINLADSGTMMLSAAWAAGQYDVLCLLFDGTNWLELGVSDN